MSNPNEYLANRTTNQKECRLMELLEATSKDISTGAVQSESLVSESSAQYVNEDEQVTLLLQQQPISTVIHKEGTFKLPPISNILNNIDQFQSSKQLEDSKLLLELCASTNSETSHFEQPYETSSDHYPESESQMMEFHQPSPQNHSASLIASPAFSAFTQDNNFPLKHLRSHSSSSQLTDDLETRSPSPIRSPSSFASGVESVSTSRENSNISTKNDRESSEESMDPSSDSGYFQGNKKRTNLPRETIKILNEWILRNIDNPYPNHSQKRILLDRTGLSNVQLSNWFINKRRRRIFSNLSGNNGQPIKKKRLIDRI